MISGFEAWDLHLKAIRFEGLDVFFQFPLLFRLLVVCVPIHLDFETIGLVFVAFRLHSRL